ncbi:MAG: dihydroxy-acid dehydratase [Bacillota bacterium]
MTRSKELRRIGPEIDALRQGMDWHYDDLDRVQIMIESTEGSSHPGSYGLGELVAEVEKGVIYAQGKPGKFTVTDICDGVAQGHEGMNYSLLSRELIAGMVEVHTKANPVDGLVLISSCDKAIPAHLVAAARLNIPVLHVPGGVMIAGPNGLTLEQIGTYSVLHQRGEINEEQFCRFKAASCPTFGACQFLGTAGTMQVMAEALGLALPGSALTPSVLKSKKESARDAGMQIVKLVHQGIKARDILTEKAFCNGVVIHAAVSGSTNALLHLPAIAREAGVELKPELFDEVNKKVPFIVDVKPAGKYPTEYLWYAGGVPAVMLAVKEFLNLDVMTCTGKTLGENLEAIEKGEWIKEVNGYLNNYKLKPEDIIKPVSNPIRKQGSIAILKGNIAPEGSVVKHSAISLEMHTHVGPARVFEDELSARDAVISKKIKPGDVLVVKYAGPKGSGMPEMFYTTEAIAADPQLISTTALVTDGRFSGATRGPAIGHVSPEAQEGGPIALVEEGDLIEIDIPGRRLNIVGINSVRQDPLDIESVLQERKKKWQPKPDESETGILRIYKKLAASPMEGGYMR